MPTAGWSRAHTLSCRSPQLGSLNSPKTHALLAISPRLLVARGPGALSLLEGPPALPSLPCQPQLRCGHPRLP